ncbi:MAG: OmpA family protein [Saprospiraceae bacterium]
MTVRQLVLSVLFALVSFAAMAQEAAMAAPYRSFTPKDQWELGIHAGVPFVLGDVDAKFPGFGGGIHIRKAFDHIFSVRIVGLYAQLKNEETAVNGTLRTSDNDWISGSAQLVAALNNFRFDRPNRRILLNGFFGIGVDNFKTDYRGIQQLGTTNTAGTLESTTNAHVEVGLGLAFRVNKHFNIGLEHTVMTVFGSNSDLLDSDQNVDDNLTTFRDVLHYPHLSLNFNLGKTTKDGMARSEPLYWVNPLTQVADAITALEARPIYNPTDTDGDGIIDDIDDEDNSPAGARVNTKGVTLDSDGDKVADYLDKEPFSPPGYSVNAQGVASVPKPISEDDVNRIVDAKIAAIKFPPAGGQWFLPMITFANNHYDISYDEYEKLYQVGTVLMQNPDLKVVAIGHTDKRGSEGYNNVLSYNRAKAAIEFLVAQYGISRDRLILNWVGENGTLIPVEGANELNRRVEFKITKGETEMARPEGPEAGKAPMKMKMNGNKATGF